MDLNNFASIEDGFFDQSTDYKQDAFDLGVYAFNYAPELTPFFALLKSKYSIDSVVETGTFLGGSSRVFSLIFNEVHTIEAIPTTCELALRNLEHCLNVHCHLGRSATILSKLLPSLKNKRVLFYLDAHWFNEFPLIHEIKEIAETHYNNCIIVIDDFKLPDRNDVEFDTYPEGQCTFEFIKESIDLVFSNYSTHFIVPKNKKSRAKFIAIPNAWNSTS
jgi:hypothetical protein